MRGVGVPHLIFRTSWVYGARGRTFLRATLDAAAAGEPLRAINDQRGAPTWCRMVAEATALVLAQTGAAQRPDALEDYGGTYHLSAAGETTWFEFARAILQRAPAPLRARAAQVAPLTTRESQAQGPAPGECPARLREVHRDLRLRLARVARVARSGHGRVGNGNDVGAGVRIRTT